MGFAWGNMQNALTLISEKMKDRQKILVTGY